jgi:hypothetical protein
VRPCQATALPRLGTPSHAMTRARPRRVHTHTRGTHTRGTYTRVGRVCMHAITCVCMAGSGVRLGRASGAVADLPHAALPCPMR